MNIYLETLKKNKKKFVIMYFVIFALCLSLSISIYRSSLDKISKVVVSEITNAALSENYNQIRNTCIKLVPDIFEEIQIFKADKEVFSYKTSDPHFYFEISEKISPSREEHSISESIVVFKVNFIPLLVISAIMSLVSILITAPFLIFEYNRNELSKNNYFFSLSRKLAHDIRSPLSTLNLISSKIERADVKELQLAVINQINQLADNLLENTKTNMLISYSDLFQQIEREFKLKAKNHNVIFENKSASEGNLLIAPTFLYASLNNMIQNSVEATPSDKSRINIALKISADSIKISIQDNGKGIPEEVLRKLGSTEITYGKGTQGNGLGFFSAYKNITSFGGKVNIKSELDVGTLIEISLPK